jgi:hypothetical protein
MPYRFLLLALVVVGYVQAFDGIRIDVDVSALKPQNGQWSPDMYMKLSSPNIAEICKAKLTALSKGKTPCNIPRKYIKKGYNPYHITIFSKSTGDIFASMDASFDVDDDTFSAIVANSKRNQFAWKIPVVAVASLFAATMTRYQQSGETFQKYFSEAMVQSMKSNFNYVMQPILYPGYKYDESGKLVKSAQKFPVKPKPALAKPATVVPPKKVAPPPKPPTKMVAPKTKSAAASTGNPFAGLLQALSIDSKGSSTKVVKPTLRGTPTKVDIERTRVIKRAALLGAGALLGGLAYGYRSGYVTKATVKPDRVESEKPKLNFIVPDAELQKAKSAPAPASGGFKLKLPSPQGILKSIMPGTKKTVKEAPKQPVQQLKAVKVQPKAKPKPLSATKAPSKATPVKSAIKVEPKAKPKPQSTVKATAKTTPVKSNIVVKPGALPKLDAVKIDPSQFIEPPTKEELRAKAQREREKARKAKQVLEQKAREEKMKARKKEEEERRKIAEKKEQEKLRLKAVAEKTAAKQQAAESKVRTAELQKKQKAEAETRFQKQVEMDTSTAVKQKEEEKLQRAKEQQQAKKLAQQQLEAKRREELNQKRDKEQAAAERQRALRAQQEKEKREAIDRQKKAVAFEKQLAAERLRDQRLAEKQARERQRQEYTLMMEKEKDLKKKREKQYQEQLEKERQQNKFELQRAKQYQKEMATIERAREEQEKEQYKLQMLKEREAFRQAELKRKERELAAQIRKKEEEKLNKQLALEQQKQKETFQREAELQSRLQKETEREVAQQKNKRKTAYEYNWEALKTESELHPNQSTLRMATKFVWGAISSLFFGIVMRKPIAVA